MKFLMLAIKYIATTLQTYFGRKGALAGWKGALADWKGALAGCFCNREFYLYHIACLLRDPSKKKYFDYMFFKEIFQFIFASLQVLFFATCCPFGAVFERTTTSHWFCTIYLIPFLLIRLSGFIESSSEMNSVVPQKTEMEQEN